MLPFPDNFRIFYQYFDFIFAGAVDFKEEVSITAVSAGKGYLALGTTDGDCIIQPLKQLKVSLFLYTKFST